MKKAKKLFQRLTYDERRLLSLNVMFSEEAGNESKLPVIEEHVIAKSSKHHNFHFDSFSYYKNISRTIKNNFFDDIKI
ncbi:hypothetical protein [Sphingobacterium detergens]|uniref:Uncharacterized protein n=1 Tax=Sphingobacterium detergens TaxID=1145106 RepID=A0A420AQW5_SPHD1|nr:hypothetical protein [Sphingobacterium detergens]RKE46830.1 hypothetical protein DFQ12_3985 [Sphingobacterium detergens]